MSSGSSGVVTWAALVASPSPPSWTLQPPLHQGRRRPPCGCWAGSVHGALETAPGLPMAWAAAPLWLQAFQTSPAMLSAWCCTCAATRERGPPCNVFDAVDRAATSRQSRGRLRWRTKAGKRTARQGPSSAAPPGLARRMADGQQASHRAGTPKPTGPRPHPAAHTPTSRAPNRPWCRKWFSAAAQTPPLHSSQSRRSSAHRRPSPACSRASSRGVSRSGGASTPHPGQSARSRMPPPALPSDHQVPPAQCSSRPPARNTPGACRSRRCRRKRRRGAGCWDG
mmetsp:Transcript_102355/g.330089  ORF Transcript_102355/g.330089 Transcript_102355/m.330089 type:complete len:282 (+) Transcript_102355:1484-2329(+)